MQLVLGVPSGIRRAAGAVARRSDLRTVVGGLAPDNDQPMPDEMRAKLQATWRNSSDGPRHALQLRILGSVHTETLAAAKLAKLLLLYVAAFEKARQRATVTLPLTTLELATALGIELRTVTRALGQFRDQGLVARKAQGVLKLTNVSALVRAFTSDDADGGRRRARKRA